MIAPILIGTLLQLLGYYALYNTSMRVELSKKLLGGWLQGHRRMAKTIGIILITQSFVTMAIMLSPVTGLLAATIILMTISSFITIFSPLKFV